MIRTWLSERLYDVVLPKGPLDDPFLLDTDWWIRGSNGLASYDITAPDQQQAVLRALMDEIHDTYGKILALMDASFDERKRLIDEAIEAVELITPIIEPDEHD